ncbi:MAG: hypothetical protein VCB26_14730 [Candidatus Hydrogenedentota bacterium]
MNSPYLSVLWARYKMNKHKVVDLKRERFSRTIAVFIYVALTVAIAAFAAAGFAAGFGLGSDASDSIADGHDISGLSLMLGTDFVLLYFLMFWLGDLMAEMKRAEPIDFRKMLYLPISLRTVFLLNFSIALISPMFVAFFVPLITFSLSASWKLGPQMLLCIPLGFMFYIMLASWTYYVQGILSFLMENKRRRQKILILLPMVFILPAFLFNPAFWPDSLDFGNEDSQEAKISKPLPELVSNSDSESPVGEDDNNKVTSTVAALAIGVESDDAQEKATDAYWKNIATTVNSLIPLGWMPLGMSQIMEGSFLMAFLSFLGLSALSTIALFLGYRSTLNFHTAPPSEITNPGQKKKANAKPPLGQRLAEMKVPFLENTTSSLAVTTLMTTLRHPSVWAQLGAPLFFLWLIYMGFSNIENIDSAFVKLLITNLTPTALIMLPFFGTITFFTNMFGFDIGGFRAYVLMPIPRWKYILGHNFTVFTVPSALAIFMFLTSSLFIEYSLMEITISILQIVQLGLMLCIVGNVVSIYFPYYIDLHNFRPSLKQQLTLILVAFTIMFILGLLSLPIVFSLLIDSVLKLFFAYQGISVGFITSIATVILVAVAYKVTLPKFGELLEQREKIILGKLMKMKA